MRRFFVGFALACACLAALFTPAARLGRTSSSPSANRAAHDRRGRRPRALPLAGLDRRRWRPALRRLPAGAARRKWFSRRYNWSPMPHAIFFHKGYAIHGTYTFAARPPGLARLRAALPSHAATLFALVRDEGMGRTRIVVTGRSARRKEIAAARLSRPRGPALDCRSETQEHRHGRIHGQERAAEEAGLFACRHHARRQDHLACRPDRDEGRAGQRHLR